MSVGNFLFSFLLPQKLNRRTNVVLAYNGRDFSSEPLDEIQCSAKARRVFALNGEIPAILQKQVHGVLAPEGRAFAER